jgi:glycine cleavage system H protein
MTMKDISDLRFAEDLGYSSTHEWAKRVEDRVRVGITDYAQDRLGDITYVEMPQIGHSFQQGQRCGTLESAKALSDLFVPVGGEVVAVNTALEESPELINQDPYEKGWIIELRPTHPAEWEALLKNRAYVAMLEGME